MTMKERPILFSGPMVLAILDGRKTMTRRVVKLTDAAIRHQGYQGQDLTGARAERRQDYEFTRLASGHEYSLKPYAVPGDRLWVRETFSGEWDFQTIPPREWPKSPIWYWADGNPEYGDWTRPRPSIHMPRWASRITLELTGARVERLQEISEEDARAEGAPPYTGSPTGWICAGTEYRMGFKNLWDSINSKRPGCSWADNPWVWALSFRRVP